MCGLAGVLTRRGHEPGELHRIAGRMADTLRHRGPDSNGVWVDEARGIALGFRRLAILDLSVLGHQPMASPSGRYQMVFNGEVYNFAVMRRQLECEGLTFRGHSDTEIILGAFDHWGIEAAVRRFTGMFAMAVWDRQAESLTLLRDRLGIKPLFIYAKDGVVSFASEIKALHAGPSFDRTIDPESVTQYLRHLYIEAPRSIFKHVSKLSPGHLLTITNPAAPLPQPVAYWTLEDAWRSGLQQPFSGSDTDAVDELDRLLSDSVRLRRQADVPLGALFSGGIDSSAVVALLQEQSDRPVKTFTVAFDRAEHNEAHHAKRVAQHLGTDHTELLVTGDDALAVVPRLADLFDEPHADTAQIPAYLVCALARRNVVVALSGDGGDELFGGYNRYTHGGRMLARIERVPHGLRRVAASGLRWFSAESLGRLHQTLTPLLPTSLRHRLAGDKLVKIAYLLERERASGMYESLVSAWQHPERLVTNRLEATSAVSRILDSDWPAQLTDRMMLADQLGYLPDDQLAKIDRVSMGVSLEVRVPLLDHRVVEFAARLPSRLKMENGTGKLLLRQVLYRRVPRELVERPKMGFSVPLTQWLRGPLRDWAEELLSEAALRDGDILNAGPIRQSWTAFLAGRSENALGLWAVLVLQAWRGRWMT